MPVFSSIGLPATVSIAALIGELTKPSPPSATFPAPLATSIALVGCANCCTPRDI
jgi:hypothetical protein